MIGLIRSTRITCRYFTERKFRSLCTIVPPSFEHDDDGRGPPEVTPPHAPSQIRTPEEIRSFREKNRIVVKGVDTDPVFSFQETGFPLGLIERIKSHGFEAPTAIQAQGWPIATNGKNIIAIGETGSGKTLGFVLPGLCHLMRQPPRRNRGDGPVVLIIAPTRELAEQIHNVVDGFASKIPTACLVGGNHKQGQIRDLNRGAEIVVATPGRLIDLMEDGDVDLKRCSYMVLDEADRMLDMGFEPQIRKIMRQVRPDRQLLMWSATWPSEVQSLAHDFFGGTDYAHVNIGSSELQANKLIMQDFKFCERFEKMDSIKEILESLSEVESKKVLIFAATKIRVDQLVRKLKYWNFVVDGIHGDKTQAMRTRALDKFRSGRINILVATDVASRGLDVNDIKVVINYDFPNNIEDYVHRIGRTGRCSKEGKSFSFFDEVEDGSKAKDLINVLKEAHQSIPHKLQEISRMSYKPKKKQFKSNFNRRNSYDDDFYNGTWRKRRENNRNRRYSEDFQ
ncbi:ATP-dependent RNA helicase p62 [Lepeophtheirus salmonis]|uniref:ATP-dependent RNA helicase p62 n=1 Tax=Lepeophtheirus salmonis TaxID=72036 RepID=UPI001AE15566|nr:ATP-dependent RNA helicase p62-like [Lepeophtheirus salmonis]